MQDPDVKRLALATGSAVLAGTAATAAVVDEEGVDKAFEALKTFDWGADLKTLVQIDEAVMATYGNAAARKELETRLVAVLKSGPSRSATDYICRTLKTIGTAESVPALAALLGEKDHSHMARYALERIPAPQAATALRVAVAKLEGELQVGVIGSLGVRRDAASVPVLAFLLGSVAKAAGRAAANSLGVIATPEAGKALADFAKKAPQDRKTAATDACLACAEGLLAAGKKAEAIALYKSLSGEDQPKDVRLAATRGMLMTAGK